MGYGSKLHCGLIRRFLPGAYYFPLINKARIPALLPYPRVAQLVGTGIQRLDDFRASVGRTLGTSATADIATEDTWWASQIASTIRPLTQDLLLSGESITPRVFKAEEVGALIASLATSDRYLSSISSLLTLERWREQMDRTWRFASQERT